MKNVDLILVAVAALNLVIFLDKWPAGAALLVLIFAVVYSLSPCLTVALVVAIAGANLAMTVSLMQEGMKSPKFGMCPDKVTPKTNAAGSNCASVQESVKTLLGTQGIEGMDNLMKQQESLLNMAKTIQPMVQQASKLIEGLPKGVLENVMKKFNKK